MLVSLAAGRFVGGCEPISRLQAAETERLMFLRLLLLA